MRVSIGMALEVGYINDDELEIFRLAVMDTLVREYDVKAIGSYIVGLAEMPPSELKH